MSIFAKVKKIFVASNIAGLSVAVQKLLPSIEVIDLQRNVNEPVGESDRCRIEQEAEVLLADTPQILNVLYSAKQLKWAQTTWAGVEKLISGLDHNKPLPCLLTRTGGAFNKIMAEYVLGYILAKERFILDVHKEQEKCVWNKSDFSNYRSLSDLTIGILGVGEIGCEVARLCGGSGMRVVGVTRTPPMETKRCSAVHQYRTTADISEVLRECDYVCNVLPSTNQTQGLLSGDMFSNCKDKKSIFINIGRGDIVDEKSLVQAINKGWLGGAVLDVFAEEPLPKDSPLWSLPGVLITPHIAGVSLPKQVAKSFVDNFNLLLENQQLKFLVDVNRGY